jgi:hypothetical protein
MSVRPSSMHRTPMTTLALAASLAALSACDRSPSSSSDVTLRDMEVVDGTANDAMVDLDNATVDGTALENAAAAVAAAPGNAGAVTNAVAPPTPKKPATDRGPNIDADAAD